MKKDEIYFIIKENMKTLLVEEGFMPEGATWIVVRLQSKKKKKLKKGVEYQYKWSMEVMPTMWTDFITHNVKVENESEYETLFTKPVDETHIDIASREYFMYSQLEVQNNLDISKEDNQ
jgi:hypothetical protein